MTDKSNKHAPAVEDGNDRLQIARERLKCVLERASHVRSGDKANVSEDPHEMLDNAVCDVSRRPGRRKKRPERMNFEIRGKAFALKDSNTSPSIYSLCRTWTHGRDDDLNEDFEIGVGYPEPDDNTLELLATKEVFATPRPHENVKVISYPEPLKRKADANAKFTTSEALLQDHMPHWKSVKKSWKEHCAVRDKRYEKSIHLLKTINNIAQQNSSTKQ